MARFNIMNKAEDLLDYLLCATEKSPKKLRLDMIPEMRKQALRVLEDIVRANNLKIDGANATSDSKQRRLDLQDDAMISIRVLDSFCEVAMKHNYLTKDQFAYLTQLSQELYDMIQKWNIGDKLRK